MLADTLGATPSVVVAALKFGVPAIFPVWHVPPAFQQSDIAFTSAMAFVTKVVSVTVWAVDITTRLTSFPPVGTWHRVPVFGHCGPLVVVEIASAKSMMSHVDSGAVFEMP